MKMNVRLCRYIELVSFTRPRSFQYSLVDILSLKHFDEVIENQILNLAKNTN